MPVWFRLYTSKLCAVCGRLVCADATQRRLIDQWIIVFLVCWCYDSHVVEKPSRTRDCRPSSVLGVAFCWYMTHACPGAWCVHLPPTFNFAHKSSHTSMAAIAMSEFQIKMACQFSLIKVLCDWMLFREVAQSCSSPLGVHALWKLEHTDQSM